MAFEFPPLGTPGARFQTLENLVSNVNAAIDNSAAGLQTQIDALSSGVTIVGSWDASSGAFPAGTIPAGNTYIVTVAGTVDGVAFALTDRLVSLGGGATYAGNWVKAENSDTLSDIANIELTPVNGDVARDLDEILGNRIVLGWDTAGSVEILVPTDAANMQSALNRVAGWRGTRTRDVTVKLEAGYEEASGLILHNGDYSHVKIISVDATVGLAAGFTGASNGDFDFYAASERSTKNLFVFRNCIAPFINAKFDMASPRGASRLGHGIAAENAIVRVGNGKGVINAGMSGCTVQGGGGFLIGADFSGAGSEGIAVQQAAKCTAQAATANGCQVDPTTAASNAAVFCSRGSSLSFQNGSATGSGRWGIDCHRGWLSAQDCDVSGAAGRGANVQDGGHLILIGADISDAGEEGARCQDGSYLNVEGADLSGAVDDALNLSGSGNIVALNGATTDASSPGVPRLQDVGTILAFNHPQREGVVFSDNGEDAGNGWPVEWTSASQGYRKYPDGSMVQWIANAAGASWSFPLAFLTTTGLSVTATPRAASGDAVTNVSSLTTSAVTLARNGTHNNDITAHGRWK